MTSYYDILGLAKSANEAEIKKAYRTLAIKWHPDKHGDATKAEATRKFQEISKAYQVLSNEDTRKKYDQYGEEGLNGSGGPGGMTPEDLFANLFGGGRGGGEGPQKCAELVINLQVSLADLYNGKACVINADIHETCRLCKGTGSKSFKKHTCAECNGEKFVTRVIRHGPMIQQIRTSCDKCHGSGKSGLILDPCDVCSGKEHVVIQKELPFTVHPGMNWGMKINLQCHGHSLDDMIQGDIIVELCKLGETPNYTLENGVLTRIIKLDLYEALSGFTYTFRHLDGNAYATTFNEVINPGTRKMIEGLGWPKFSPHNINTGVNTAPPRDPLQIKFDIIFPPMLVQSFDALKINRHREHYDHPTLVNAINYIQPRTNQTPMQQGMRGMHQGCAQQ